MSFKLIIILLVFIVISSASAQQMDNITKKLETHFIFNKTNDSISFNEYIQSNHIKLIYFYNLYSCKKCFYQTTEMLQKLSTKPDFLVVVNYKKTREMRVFKKTYHLNKVYLIDKPFYNFSFFYRVRDKKIFIPGVDNNLSQFLEQ